MLTLFHDYTEPASVVAAARLDRLIGEGVAAEIVGFEAIGVDLRLPVSTDVAASAQEVAGVADAEGVTLRLPPFLPPTGLAHVVGDVADRGGRGAAWRRAVHAALWERGEAIDEPTVLRDLADEAGLDPSAVAAALDDPGQLAARRRRSGRFRRDGVGGVPTILAQRTLVPGLLADDDVRALAALD